MHAPKLTPLQALQMLRVKDNLFIEGHYYTLDGPMGCPAEAMFPVAYATDPNVECEGPAEVWYPTDGMEDEVSESTTWLKTVDGNVVSE